MPALPFRGPSGDRPGERVVLHTEHGDIRGQVMWCVAEGGTWNVYVLAEDRRSIWRSPPSYIERLPGGSRAVRDNTVGRGEPTTSPLPADPPEEVSS